MRVEFILRTADLARAAPNQWTEFLTEFARLADEQAKDLVRANGENIFTAQGRAQHAAQLLETFADIKAKADRIIQNHHAAAKK